MMMMRTPMMAIHGVALSNGGSVEVKRCRHLPAQACEMAVIGLPVYLDGIEKITFRGAGVMCIHEGD